ncbi:1-acyl-sn-glycerol-3-phosphate acyltransferase [Cellulomonas sp. PhB143]|uniref:1-acyl-sn-glycerol-3-phosphate acyltransferase n=1 Tax=Cellulomonas sp. PhB143 TaxID=2485186 RepID=UPI000FB99659|nr:1-acyl-sn-glycerol-3-phosphate acyltransferase [Cellulomonas sp. PhB143]ROS78600.1 acyltransferase-like protein [Cellulomonas sp. PhB143]
MRRLPPRWVRRLVLGPLVVLLAVLLVPTTAMLALLVLGIVSWALPGRLRLTRVLWMASFYVLWDAAALVALFALWVASGFGWAIHRPAFQRAHYALARRMITAFFWQVRWTLRLTIDVEGAEALAPLAGRPVVVVSRHAGPGDSFVLVDALLNRFAREPRIVLKDSMQWDPAIDVLLNRIPTRFITPHSRRRPGAPGGSAAVGDLAVGMDDDDALLIFPEGGNVTPRRQARRVQALRDAGDDRLAAYAESMRHVMAPHLGGVLAALDAAPEAEIVFVAHTGLESLVTARDIWRALPMDKRIVMAGRTVPRAQVPTPAREREEWLFAQWLSVDEWIDAYERREREAGAVP